MNYPAAELRGIKTEQKPSALLFWLVQNLSEEGFPTSGNDRIRKILTPKLSFEEFFD